MPANPTSPSSETPRDVVLRALAELNLQPGPAAAQVRVCLAVRELFGADRAWLSGRSLAYDPEVPALVAPDSRTYAESLADGASSPSAPARESLFPALCAQAAEAPGPSLFARSATATGAAAELLAAIGASALLVRPLRVRGVLWGHLATADAAGFEPSADALAAFETLAASVEGLIGHMEVEARLGLSRTISEQIIEDIPVALFAVDAEHRIARLNERTARIAGMDKGRILREGCFGLFCDKKTHFEKCPGHASLHTGDPWDGEADLDGRHYRVAVRPLRVDGRTPLSLVTLDDQTDVAKHRKLIEKMVPRLEYLLETGDRIRDCIARFATTNQEPDEVFSSVLSTIVETAGATYAFICRFDPDGSLVRTHAKVRSPEYDRDYITPKVRGEIARRFSDRREMFYRLGQEEDRVAEIDSMLVRARSTSVYFAAIVFEEHVWGYLGILSDKDRELGQDEFRVRRDFVNLLEIAVRRANLLAEVDRKEKGLVAAVEEARRAAQAKTMFLATMSHEIRTPLNAIVGFSDILAREKGLPASARESVEGISRSAAALLALLNDVLDLSKLETTGAADMLRGECDLGALFRDMDTVFRYSARAKGLVLRPSIPANFPRLRLSGQRMRQILLNLIGNAVKFTERGYVAWTAAWEPAGGDAVSLAIDVSDTGIGIPADRLEAVFDPFVQAGTIRPDARSTPGTGLGLPIVRRLVEACGGDIRVESEPGRGSVFRIRIGRVETLPPEAPRPAEPAAAPRAPLDLDGFVPLLVDDIPLNLRILELHFRALGVSETIQVSSGIEALGAMRDRRPSAVFTDLWMPGMDGAALARAIRADPAFRGIPVVAVTADNDVAASFDASVFDDVLVKPIGTDGVAACLARILPSA